MVTVGDFIGKYESAVNDFTQAKILLYIQKYEKHYALKLLGVDLYNLWVVNPLIPPFDAITNPFVFQSSCGTIHESIGIKDMLTGFIYFHLVNDIRSQQTLGGSVSKANENSMQNTSIQSGAWERFNSSVYTYEAIQAFICEHLTDYPTFKGVEQDIIIPYF